MGVMRFGGCVCVCTFQIQPDEVCTPADPGPVFLVVDCPSEEFVQPLCTNQVLGRWRRLHFLLKNAKQQNVNETVNDDQARVWCMFIHLENFGHVNPWGVPQTSLLGPFFTVWVFFFSVISSPLDFSLTKVKGSNVRILVYCSSAHKFHQQLKTINI